MKPRRILPFAAAISFALTAATDAADVVKAANTNALNLGTSWTGGTAPGSGDIAVWDSTITAGNSSALSADVSWGGIKVTNVGGSQNNGSGTNSVQITGSGSQLTLGTSGLDMSAATQAMQIQSKILLGGSQDWVVANANTHGGTYGASFSEDLYFAATTVGTPINFGGFTVSTSGAGSIVITNGYTVNNGTLSVDNAGGLLIQSGSSRKTTLGSNLTLDVKTGRTLVFKANSGTDGIAVDSAAAVNLTGATLKIEATNNTAINQSGKLTMAGISILDNTYSSGSNNTPRRLQLSGGLEVTGTATWKESNSSPTATIFNSALTGGGTLNFQNTTTARRADWSGDNSGFTGTVNINGGSGNRNLRLTSATAGSASATWAPAAGNILEVDGVAVNLGTLNGAGTVTNSHASNIAAITVGAGTFSGAITNGAPALGMSLTKNTAGTLTLSGNGNTFTGDTLISGGKLVATQTGALSTSSAISVNGSGAIFDGTGTMGDITVADGLGAVQNGNGTSGALTFSSLTFNGDGALHIVTSSATPSARVIVTGALTTTPANGQVTVNGSGSWSNGVNNLLSFGSFGGAVTDFTLGTLSGLTARQSAGPLSISGSNLYLDITGDSPKWTGADNGNWVVGSTGANGNWQLIGAATPTDFIANDSVLFDDTAPGSKTVNISAANVSVASAGFNNSSSNYTLTSTGGFGVSSGTIAKNGSGSLTIENPNTTSGGVQLNAGTLKVNDNSALGSGALTIAGGTTLDNTSGGAVTATNAQNWNGDFTFTGSNDLTLGAAAMNASRQITVNAGTLTVGGISGSGFGFTKAGAGTLAVGASSYSGATVVNGGTLKATSATSFTTTSSITLADTAGVALDLNGNSQTIGTITGGGAAGGDILLNGAVLTTGTAADTTFAGDLIGAGGLNKQGAGRLILTGDKSGYTGATTVSAGTLDLDTSNGNFGAAVTVTAGAANNSINVGSGLFVQGNGLLTTGISGGSAGFGARGGNLTVNVGGAGAMINRNSSGSGGLGQMIFGSATSDSRVIVQNEVGINNNGGTRDLTVNAGTGTASAEIAGVISAGGAGGISGIIKKGNGDLILSNANTYTGTTKVDAGRIVIGHAQALQFSTLDTASAGKVTATGFATPTLGGLTGSTDLAIVIDTGYSGITTLTLNPQGTQSQTYSGVIADGAADMNLVKSGTGTQTLNGANTYTGSTTINGGTLALGASGSIDGTTGVSLGTNGTFDISARAGGYTVDNLTGSGGVIGSLTVSTRLSIGNSPGTMDMTGNLTLGASSTFVYDMVGGTSGADLGNVGGTLTIGTSVILDLVELGTYTLGDKFTLFGYGAGISGTFQGLADDSSFLDDLNNEWVINYNDASAGLNGGTGTSFVTITAVPEPAAAVLGAFGMLALLRRRRIG